MGGGGCGGGEGAEGGGGAEGGWSCWGSNRTLFSLLFFASSEYGSMWAVGAVGVLEERNACGRTVWGEGGKRACGGGGEGGGVGVRAVRDVRAVRAGGAGGHAGAAIVCKCGEGAVCAVWAARAVGAVGAARAEYGSIWGGCEEGMWAVGWWERSCGW